MDACRGNWNRLLTPPPQDAYERAFDFAINDGALNQEGLVFFGLGWHMDHKDDPILGLDLTHGQAIRRRKDALVDRPLMAPSAVLAFRDW